MDKNLEKIINFFEELKSPALYILKNKYENPTASGLLEEDEWFLPPYAIIHIGKEEIKSDEKYKFEKKSKFDIACFAYENCNPIEGVLDQLKSEGYEIIYNK